MKITRRKSSICIFALAILVVVSGFSAYNHNQSKANEIVSEDSSHIKYLHASWNCNYADIEEISEYSDLVAVVEVEDKIKDYDINKIPFTEYSLKIIDSISDSSLGEENLNVIMTGVQNEKKHVEVIDDPLMKKNDQYLLFLRKNDDGTYKILGGPCGRLVYDSDNKTVTSLCIKDEKVKKANPNINLRVDDEKVNSIRDKIKMYKGIKLKSEKNNNTSDTNETGTESNDNKDD
jgi:hypothetical protein